MNSAKNRYRKYTVIIVSMSILISVYLSGCGRLNSSDKEIDCSLGVIKCVLDINHDGIDEELYIDYLPLTYNSQGIGLIDIVDSNGRLVWEDTFALPHMAWKEYYRVTLDEQDYLLLYLPDYSQGIHWESYKLFSLDDEGNEVVEDAMSLYELDGDRLTTAIAEFNTKADDYKAHGTLLISTWDGMLQCYSE